MSKSPWARLGRGISYFVLLFGAILTLVPLVWLVASTTKSKDDLFHYTFFAPHFTLENYTSLFAKMPFLNYLMNRGKKAIVVIMLSTMLIPGQVLMAPLYELINLLGMMDSWRGIIVPGAVSVFGIFLFRQSILQLPNELMHAGRIDGCTEFRLYWDIVMPVSRPMIGAFCLISFMGAWNSFLWPQIILHNRSLYTLPIALNQLRDLYNNQYGTLMAGTLLSILPVVILFLVLQKEFVAGLTAGAVKG
ncbi:MAG: carbohydrate ABC transporter permease [Armatimonadetes bacterium]|nr:carbohydrate ABC transporter permease [Armatimonadota bacterium]